MFNERNQDNEALYSSEIFSRYMEKMASDRSDAIGHFEKLEKAINENYELRNKMASLQRELYNNPEKCKKLGIKVARIVMALNIVGGIDDQEFIDEEDDDEDWVEEE